MSRQQARCALKLLKMSVALGNRSLVSHGNCQSLKKEGKDKECRLTGPACPQGVDRAQWSMGKAGWDLQTGSHLMR